MKAPGKPKGRFKETKPGGKALERLHQFEVERGLEKTKVEQSRPGKALPKRVGKKEK
jgi:hypothetical protein